MGRQTILKVSTRIVNVGVSPTSFVLKSAGGEGGDDDSGDCNSSQFSSAVGTGKPRETSASTARAEAGAERGLRDFGAAVGTSISLWMPLARTLPPCFVAVAESFLLPFSCRPRRQHERLGRNREGVAEETATVGFELEAFPRRWPTPSSGGGASGTGVHMGYSRLLCGLGWFVPAALTATSSGRAEQKQPSTGAGPLRHTKNHDPVRHTKNHDPESPMPLN